MGKEKPPAFSEGRKTEILRRRNPVADPGFEHGFSEFEPPLLPVRIDHRDPSGFKTACFFGSLVLAQPRGKGRFVNR